MTSTPKTSLSFVSLAPKPLSSSSCIINTENASLLVFPSGALLALYDISQKYLIESWKHHEAQINCVRSFYSASHYIVSGDANGTLVVWHLESRAPVFEVKAHKDSIARVAVLGNEWICCVSADHTMSVWRMSATDSHPTITLFQTMNFGHSNMMECCDMSELRDGTLRIPLIACAGIDMKIHVYMLSNDNSEFKKVCALQGPSDWLRDMKFLQCDDGSLLLATACQDTYVRVWKVKQQTGADEDSGTVDSLDLSSIDLSTIASDKSFSLSRSSHMIQYGNKKWSIMLETLLSMHEDWVHSLDWAPPVYISDVNPETQQSTTRRHQPIRLLTASMDRTMIIWQPDTSSEHARGVWNSVARMGSFGGKAGLTGQMGYLAARFIGAEGDAIIAHGYHGSFHYWKKQPREADADEDDTQRWTPDVTVSGHFGSVSDIDWDPSKRYFLSTSQDQTTRLFAPWSAPSTKPHLSRFYEIARPQIHGYDINCISTIKGTNEHRFVSGADEKVLRVFDAPLSFVQTLENISQITTRDVGSRVESAEIPAIGLSNKSIHAEDDKSTQKKVFSEPPFEEQLLKDTLWPELCKMFGHANELSCVASSNNGAVIASSCQARKEDEAELRLWDTNTWEESCVLPGHRTSVTSIAFSPCDKYMISVSRDMNLIFYERVEGSLTQYQATLQQKVHSRLILDCSWSYDSKYILTAGRDKLIRVWSVPDGAKFDPKVGLTQVFETKFKQPVTSVAFCHESAERHLLALGLDNGEMEVWQRAGDTETWKRLERIESRVAHCATVRRMRWRKSPVEENVFELLTCSEDGSIRLFSVRAD